jgi:hypothetical protein
MSAARTIVTASHDGYEKMDALTFEAPYLIEKLLKLNIIETEAEGHALFLEVKRWLVAAHSIPEGGAECSMYSHVVDEVWHQFVLFTREYEAFTRRYFGRFIHHNPGNAPTEEGDDFETMTLPEFAAFYERLFGLALPDLWYDDRNVRVNRRASRKVALAVASGADGAVDLLGSQGGVLLSVGEMARPALEYIARTPVFFVRELPGDLTDEEKVGLVATLVEYELLRVDA